MSFVTLDAKQAARLNSERGREPLSFADYGAKRYFRLPRPRGGCYRDAFDSYEYFDAEALHGWVQSQKAKGLSVTNPKTSKRIAKKDLDELLYEFDTQTQERMDRERQELKRKMEKQIVDPPKN